MEQGQGDKCSPQPKSKCSPCPHELKPPPPCGQVSDPSSSTLISSSSSASSCLHDPTCNCCKCKYGKMKRQPPDLQHELNCAKAVLQECSTYSGDNLFDHLADLIRKILDEHPPNVIDYFEEFSRGLREKKFHVNNSFLEEYHEEPRTLLDCERNLSLLDWSKLDPLKMGEEAEEEGMPDFPKCLDLRPIMPNENVLQLHVFWTLCGFGFHFDEVFKLSYAMMKLISHPIISNCRFWGKIFGKLNPYYIVEVELCEAERQRRYEKMYLDVQDEILRNRVDENNCKCPCRRDELVPGYRWRFESDPEELAKMKPEAVDVPESKFVPEPDVPPELIGSGLNRKCYFVINCLTDDWYELPYVTPKQIVAAKQIKKFFTGDLDAEIYSYPNFAGYEKSLLRATIARISAGAYIAPCGLYKIKQEECDYEGEEEEEEAAEEDDTGEDGDHKKNWKKILKERDSELTLNPKFKPIPNKDLICPSQWCHIRPSILDQGRVMFYDWNKPEKSEDFEEEEDDVDIEEGMESKRYKLPDEAYGPAILSSCEDDGNCENIPNWTARYTDSFNLMNQMVIMRSNIWPGAYNIATNRFCDNIYMGWGLKYVSRNYSPPHIPLVQQEYAVDCSIMEISDPSAQLEEEWRLSHTQQKVYEAAEEECDDDEKEDEKEENF